MSARYKWVVVAVSWCVYFLNQADRRVIFSVFPLLQKQLGLSNTVLRRRRAYDRVLHGLHLDGKVGSPRASIQFE